MSKPRARRQQVRPTVPATVQPREYTDTPAVPVARYSAGKPSPVDVYQINGEYTTTLSPGDSANLVARKGAALPRQAARWLNEQGETA